jgi:hypothetical protein
MGKKRTEMGILFDDLSPIFVLFFFVLFPLCQKPSFIAITMVLSQIEALFGREKQVLSSTFLYKSQIN